MAPYGDNSYLLSFVETKTPEPQDVKNWTSDSLEETIRVALRKRSSAAGAANVRTDAADLKNGC